MTGTKEKKKLGKILLQQKLVNPSDLQSILDDQSGSAIRLASKALERGLVSPNELLKALSEQHGVPAANLDEVEISLVQLDIVPQDIARKHLIIPLSVEGDTVHLAMANPGDRRVVDEIEFVSGKRVFPYVALQSQLLDTVDRCYQDLAAGRKVFQGKNAGTAKEQRAAALNSGQTDDSVVPGTVIADSTAFPEDTEIDIEIEVDVALDQIATEDPSMPILSEPPAKPITIPPQPVAVQKSNKKIKILVVDDEEDILMLISRVLTDKNYNVVTASRGREAIEKVQSENPDMIILDAMLPEVHGFDICKKIKGSSKYGHIPVIMISAIYRGWRYAQDLKDSYGVDDFIEKPFKIQHLIKMVESYSTAQAGNGGDKAKDLSKAAEGALTESINAYRAGRIDEAIDLIKKGLKIDPLAYKLHYHLALLLGKKGLSYQAIRALENTLELAPEYFPALKNLAVLYQKAGFKFKAVETWERALRHCDEDQAREGIKRHLVSLL